MEVSLARLFTDKTPPTLVSSGISKDAIEPDVYKRQGSEAGKEETIQNFEVTYYRPEGKKMDVQWISSDGRNGWVDYMSAYHTQDYYYPAWISENS